MNHVDTFTPGTLVDGRFRIVRLLGRGGMGEVYEADDLELRERVALKVLHQLWRSDEERIERFRREIHLSRKVTHPNVCRIFDVFKHRAERDGEEFAFVSMELLEGASLDDYLEEHGRLPPEQAEKLVAQMTSALSAAHEAGVIHRDFKTGNVMLVPGKDGDLRAVVTDFGLARSGDPTDEGYTQEGAVVGSISYMAPEQVKGDPVSPASDIFALGVVMYEIVTGASPFREGNIVQVLGERISKPAPSVREIAPDLDERWEQVVARCLELEPEDRYTTASEVSEALSGEEAPEHTEEIAAWKRHPALSGLAAVVAIALVATLASLFWSQRSHDPLAGLFAAFDPTQMTTDLGLEIDPSFSPDGKSLVYASDASGSFEIRVRNLDAQHEEVTLTDDGQENVQPTWSPDARSIAYYSEKRGGIWVMPSGGGERRQITDFGSHPSWSPDGRYLAFQSEGSIELSAGSAPALPPSTIWVVSLEAGEPRAVTEVGKPDGGHGTPTWSPDGERIVFSTYYGRRSEIWSVESSGEGLVPLVQETPASFHPVFTPDGSSLLYSAVAEGERYGLWTVPVSPRTGEASGEPRLLANLGSVGIRQLAISADGKQLAYTALATHSNLFFQGVDPETAEAIGEPAPLTTGSARNNRPSFSPDGRLLAFDRWRVGTHRDIWILEMGSDEPRPLTRGEGNDSQSSWSSEDERVVYVSEGEQGLALFSQAPGSEQAKLIAELDANADNVRLSPDGQRLAFHAGASGGTIDLWIQDLSGGEARQLTHDPELAGFPAWSPDGDTLAFEIRRGEDTHVVIMSLRGGTSKQLTHSPGQSWPYSWSPDGRRIAFAGERGGIWNVYWVDVASGLEHALTRFQRGSTYVRYPAWSPRNDGIVFELAETTGDIFWVRSDE